MNVAESIKQKVAQNLNVHQLDLVNESHMHAGPATDSHFKLTVVSDDFADQPLVRRHQKIYRLLGDELAGPVHALALHAYTVSEWDAALQESPASPACRGGE